MTSDRLYKTCLFLTVLLSVAAYVVAEISVAQYAESPIGLAWLALPAIGLGWWVTEGRVGFKWPGWLTFIAVAAIIIRGVARSIEQGVDIAVFCEFLTLILTYKVWDHRHSRDHGQILTLCAFLAIGAILTGTSLLLGLMLAALVPLLLAAVMMYQVRPDDRLGLPPRAVASDSSRPRLRRAFLASLAVLWIGSVAVFIYFPREIGFGAFGRWGQNVMQSGYRDNIELGSAGLISESQETVLELELRDGLDRVLGGSGQVFYLRGAVLDEYRRDTGSWARSDRRDANEIDINPVRRTWTLSDTNSARRNPAQKVVQTVTVLDSAAGPLFAIWRPMDVTFLAQTGRLTMHSTDLTMMRPQSSGPFRYSVTSFRGTDVRSRVDTSRIVDFDSEIVRGEAARVLTERGISPDPAQRPPQDDGRAASAIEDYLRERFSYTLEIRAPRRGQDPIEWFLLEERRGHCEYFASAMTAMCRSVGIDARLVTGYVATEWDPGTRRYIVRQSNAHAWVEARGAGVWRTYDPTPPADLRRIHEPPRDLLSRLKRFFDSAENRWATGVVGYDEHARRQLVGPGTPFISWVEDKMRAVSEARTPRAARQARAELRRLLLLTAGSALGLVALIVLARPAWRWWRRITPRLGAASRAEFVPPGLGFYPEMLAALARRGRAKPISRPPLLHAQTIAAAEPALARHIARVAGLYYRATFGARPLSGGEREEAERLVRELARSGDGQAFSDASGTP